MPEPNTTPTPDNPNTNQPSPPTGRAPADPQGYWRANLKLILMLLTVWALVSFGFSIILIEPLNKITIGSVPLGFWFSQQGSIYVFVILIFVYAWRMDKLDRKHGVNE